MDSTLPPAAPSDNKDIPVKVDTLSIDGTDPSVGDEVEIKVKGSVSKVLNGTAFVTPESINDMPIEDSKPDDSMSGDDGDNMKSMAQSADASGSYGY